MITALIARAVRSRRAALFTLAGWLVLAAALATLAPRIADVEDNRTTNDPPATAESVRAEALLRTLYPAERGIPALVVLHNPRGLDEVDATRVARITTELTGPGRPDRIGTVVSTANRPAARTALVSPDGTTTMIVVTVTGSTSTDGFGAAVDRIRAVAGRGSPRRPIRVTGPAGIVRDTVKVFGSANVVLLATTIGLVLVLLLGIYRSPLLALVPLVAVGVAIGVAEGLGALAVRLGLFAVNAQAVSIMTVLLFGVGTDYCLFVSARYREEYAADPRTFPAMTTAVRRVAPAVLSSGATVVLGLLALLLATLPALRGFGPFLALSVAVMAVVGVTLVPAGMALLGRAAFWPRAVGARRTATGDRTGWTRLAATVTRRPVAAIVAVTAVLVALSTGLLAYRDTYNFVTGFRVDTDSRQGQHLLEAAFPAGRLAPTTVLVTQAGVDLRGHGTAIRRIGDALAGLPGVAGVEPAEYTMDGSAAALRLTYRDNPYESQALRRTEQVRAAAREVAAATLPRARVLVAGESARSLDIRTANRRDLLVVAPVTVLAIGLVLALLLRAVVAPLYLVATIVASFAATLGLTVLALLVLGGDTGMGVRVTGYIFVFLVALGVDYNILLMSRVREEVDRHGHTDGVPRALARTGGVITSAGVILAGTFAVLMTQPIRELYQFGFAMAAGILIDTLLIRAVLVPAIAQLLGPRSWWPGHPVGPDRGHTTPRG